jgi:hypothetical protein
VNHQDAELSDVVVILAPMPAANFQDAVQRLQSQGLEVSHLDPDNAMIEGVIAADKLKSLRQLPFVKYVRKVFEYTADYPSGDPRDLDASSPPPQDLPDVDDAGI